MKKYKVVGLPKMHNGGIGAGHPHKLKKNRNKRNYSFINTKPFSTLTNFGPNNASPDDPIKEKKLSRKQNKELGEMSYEEMVNYVNEQNNMFKELNLPAQYKMPDLSKVYGRKELQGLSREERKAYKNMPFYDQIKFRTEKIRTDDFYNVDDISTQEIVDPIPTTTDIKPNWYGDDHYNMARSIISSFDKIEKEYVLPKYKQREDGSYFKVRDEISRYDSEVEELRKKYETIEAQMRASFGDREGDPTHAEDWQNRDGKLYRKQLNALGSELQNLLLKRREQAGENVGVQKWSVDPETGIPKIGMSFTRDPESSYEFNKETKDKMGYIPKNYSLDFSEFVIYPKESNLQIKQEQLSKQAELLWTLGAIGGYVPNKKVPIGGSIEDLEEFIKNQETDIADFKKQKTASNTQLKDYAAYIGVKNFDPKEGNLASEANYKLLRKAMGKNPSDQYLMKIYKDIFMEGFDPNATQLTQEQMGTMIDAGWGDGSMDAIKDLAKVVAYGAPAAPFVVSGLVTLMNNPFFHLVMDGYFAYETPQMVEDFYKNAKNVMETTEAGTWDRLTGVGGMSLDAAFVAMGFGGGKRIVTKANKARKTLTGAPKSEAELSKVLREQLSSKGKIPSRQYKIRMKESNFRKKEELIENASLKELQAMAANQKGIVMDEAGNTIIQSDLPVYLNYTKKGKPGVELTDASGKVISNTGKGDVIIGMGKTERVSVSSVGSVKKVVRPNTWVSRKIKIPGTNATIEVGLYQNDKLLRTMGDAAVARGAGAATKAIGEANFEIAKASEVGLGEQYGNATVMAIESGVKISPKELDKLSKKVHVLIANGQAIVLNQKALPQYTSKIKYKASELGFEKQRIEHGSPIGIQGELDPLFRQRADVDQTVLKPKEKGFTRSESTGSSSSGTGIYFSQPANMQKNLERGMPNANPTGYALSPQGEGYLYESTIKPDAVIVRKDGMSKILNKAGYTWGTGIANVPEEAYKILRDAGVDIVVGSFEKGSVNEYLVINPEAITELGQTAKTGVRKYQVTYADRGMQELIDFDTKAEAVAFVEKMGGKQSKDSEFQDYYSNLKSGDNFQIKEIKIDKEEILGPIVGAAGAAAAAVSDEDPDASMMAALPLMIFGRGKKINLKSVYKNIREFFKTVPALKNVPFKQSELQNSVLKNLPAKFKKEFGPDVTFEQLVKEQPEMLKNLIVEHIVNRYEYYESNIPGIPTKRQVTERELPIFYAEQDEAAQFALDFNTAWMEGSLDPRSKELIKPVKDGIKEARELEEEIASFKPLYDDAIEEVRDGIQNDWNRKVMFPGSMGPMSDAASKEEAVKIGKDLLKVYKDAAAKVVGTENHGNYDVLIKDLEDDIAYIAQMGVDKFRKLNKHNTVYSATEFQAEQFINANSDIVYDYYDMQDRRDTAYDQIKDQIDAIGPIENVLAPDIAERVNALRGNVQDILDTSKAATLEARGTLNKKSVDDDIISALADARYSESDLKGTVGEAMKGDYYSFAGVRDRTNKGNVGQITKRGLPANSDNLDELYTMYEKGFLRDKLKGLVVRQEDTLRQPIDVAGTMAHEDKHIYQAVIGYLDPHVESQIYGYQVADQKSDLGKAIQEVLIEPKKIDDPSATVDEGDIYSTETYMASPVEADANLQKERVKYAYKKFQEIMNADNPVSKFRKLKESAGSDARYQKAVIEEIVKVMKIPENKAQFIEDLMSSPIGNAVNRHFKKKYRGAIDPFIDDTKTMAGKEMARQFLEMLPALLIGAGLISEMSDAESPEELMTAGILGFATRGKIKGLSKFRGVTKTVLTFKSFMPNGKIMNLAKDKMGRIPTQQALDILAKEGSGSYKSEVLTEALKTKFNGNVPSKIDPEILKNLAEETIIPLNLDVVDKKTTVGVDPEYGFDHIGYRDPKQQEIIGRNLTSNAIEAASEEARITTQHSINDRAEQIKKLEEEMDNLEDVLENFDDYEDKGYFPTGTRPSEFKKELEEVTKRYDELIADKPPHNLENNTILFDSDALPGLGSDDHSSGVNNLAHVHYTVRSDSPDTFTVTQFQSDFFQDREKRLQNRLNQTDEQFNENIKSHKDHIAAQQKIIDEGEMLPDGSFRTADGQIISKYLIDNEGLGPSLDGLKGAQSFKTHKEGIKVLQKTWEARTLQETVDYAARNGQTKFRFPTGETASKLQNYGDDVAEAIKTGSKEKLVKTGDEEKLQITKRYEKTYPKLIEKIYGVKLRKVSDAQGNSWWEFDIPKDMIEGTRDIIAYKEGGQIKRKLKRPNPQFEELELTEEEALAYAQKGYIVEAIS